MPLDFPAQRRAVDGKEEVAVGHRQVEGGAPPEAGDEIGDQCAVERVQLQVLGAVNPLAGELRQELRRRLIGVDGDARRGLGRLVQPGGVGRADVDPGAVGAGEVANRDRRLVRLGQAAREADALREFQAIGEDARREVLLGLGRMARRLYGQRLVDTAIDVREPDLEVVDQSGIASRVSKRRLSQITTRSS